MNFKTIALPADVESDIQFQVKITLLDYRKFINCPIHRDESFCEIKNYLKAHRYDPQYKSRVLEVFYEKVCKLSTVKISKDPININIKRSMKTQELLLELAR